MKPPTFTVAADDSLGRQMMAYYVRLVKIETETTKDYAKLQAAEAKREEFREWHRSSVQAAPTRP